MLLSKTFIKYLLFLTLAYSATGCLQPSYYVVESVPYTNKSALEVTDPNSLSFGFKPVGSISDQLVLIKNTGINQVSLDSDFVNLAPPFSFKGGVYPGTGGTCGSALSENKTCILSFEYSPTVVAIYTNNVVVLKFHDRNFSNTLELDLTGSAGIPASLALESNSFDFGSVVVGSSSSLILTFSNNGAFPVTSPVVTNSNAAVGFLGGSYPGAGGSCGETILPGDLCTVDLSFSPVTNGAVNDVLSFSYDDGSNPQVFSINLVGHGSLPPVTVCGVAAENDFLTLGCPTGFSISSVLGASYGTPNLNSCQNLQLSSCHATSSVAVLSANCVGKASCAVGAQNLNFGDPCSGTAKRLAVVLECSSN